MPGEMKYVVIVGDGMADYPVDSLGGKTPLMVAKTPNMDWMARHGEIGLVRTIFDGLNPGSEVANFLIMGYDFVLYFTGRGPIEAASLGDPPRKHHVPKRGVGTAERADGRPISFRPSRFLPPDN